MMPEPATWASGRLMRRPDSPDQARGIIIQRDDACASAGLFAGLGITVLLRDKPKIPRGPRAVNVYIGRRRPRLA